jgi:hypothetical protein
MKSRAKQVARRLRPLLSEVVFVGGCTTGLFITDEAAAEVRPTFDVDVIAEITSYADYATFPRGLSELGFETGLAESRAIAGKEGPLANLYAVVTRLRVCDNLARILVCGQVLPGEFIETKLFRPPTSTVPFTGEPVVIRPTALATSSAAMGWISAVGRRTLLP